MTFEMTSPAFEHSQAIPLKYTCDGEDRSPPLQWTDPPLNTVSFAMVMDDPDAPAGTWDHWILFNIPNHLRSLPEGVPPRPELEDGSRHGGNSWRRTEYGGPCPPSGTHRYFFKLFALDSMVDLPAGASKAALLAAIQGHILAQADLMGTYSR